jgi:beta-galactosidase
MGIKRAKLIAVLLPTAAIFVCSFALADESPRRRECIDFDWKFTTAAQSGAEQPTFDDSAWQQVDLPHDWSIYGPFDPNAPSGRPGAFLPTGVGWYRKVIKIPDADKGRQISLEFDGAYEYAEVWFNGHDLGLRPYGFIGFSYDVTPYVNFGGDNTIAVKVDNSRQTNCRWYSGSGIYRDVWLVTTDGLHIPQSGTYITTPKVTADAATVHVAAEVRNDRTAPASYQWTCTILDADGRELQSVSGAGQAEATNTADIAADIALEHPHLWTVEYPQLYAARLEIKDGSQLVDHFDAAFGIRTLEFDVDKGVLLNGKHTKLNGVCLHGDGGAVGVAVPKDVWRRRLTELKEMGCNAIRTSHNPPDPDFLDLCDELGFLVMDEAFDEWSFAKNQVKQGYHTLFKDWHDRDATDFIRRDRNHPCVVLWSAGNEIPDQTSPQGPATARELVELFHRLDPTRPVTAGCDNVYAEPRSASPEFMAALDIAGYNYVDRWRNRSYLYFRLDREKYPQRKIIGTEDASMGGPRGNYGNPFQPEAAAIAAAPLASAAPALATAPAAAAPTTTASPATSTTTTATAVAPPPFPGRRRFSPAPRITVEQLWQVVAENDYVEGDFMWTGIDYLGEAGVGAPSGVIDTAGFKKDGYYFYQSQWTDKPMLHLFPHWNWQGHEGEVLPVYCYTNCDSVELHVNGKSYGTKGYGMMLEGMRDRYGVFTNPGRIRTTADLHLAWDVPYEPGTLRAVGMKGGQVVATEEIATTGEPAALHVEADRTSLAANGRDIAHVTVKVVDDQGRLVPTASNSLKFVVAGAGQLIGVDNGSLSIDEPFKTDHRKANAGLALALVQVARTAGPITVTVKSDGLADSSVTLDCR